MSTTAKKTAVPAGVKKPTDHQAKAEDAPAELRCTLRGREWVVPADALDDFELLDDFNALEQHQNAARFPSILRRLLGNDQMRDAMDALRDETTGRVSIEAGADFVAELMQELNPSS